jgi:hypothetical protein
MPLSKTVGALASGAWLEQRGLDASRVPHWYVEITIGTDSPDTRLEVNIYPEEWGFVFRRGQRVSSIRITDVAFVHGVDEHRLLAETPSLERICDLLATLERRHAMTFLRDRPSVRSNLVRATSVIRPWMEQRP